MHPCATVLSNVPSLAALLVTANERMMTSLARVGAHLCISAVIRTVTAAAANRQRCTCTHAWSRVRTLHACVHVHKREDHLLVAVRTVAITSTASVHVAVLCLSVLMCCSSQNPSAYVKTSSIHRRRCLLTSNARNTGIVDATVIHLINSDGISSASRIFSGDFFSSFSCTMLQHRTV